MYAGVDFNELGLQGPLCPACVASLRSTTIALLPSCLLFFTYLRELFVLSIGKRLIVPH